MSFFSAPVRFTFKWYYLPVLLAIYVLVLFRWGYEFGRYDNAQVTSYAKFLNNPELYPSDFYLQNLHQAIPNERYFFSVFLSWLGDYLEPASLVLHAVFALLLFYLLFTLARKFIDSDWLSWLSVLVLLLPFYHFSLGANELYYNTFFVSNPVKTIGLLAVILMLNRQYIAAFLLVAFITILQPVNGIQLFTTFTGILFLGKLWGRINITWKQFFIPFLLYACTGLVYVVLLKLLFEKDTVANNEFFRILFDFRAPHHYLPSAFSVRTYIVFGIIFAAATYFYYRRSAELFLFFLISFLGCAVYTVGVEVYRLTDFASLQWFKTTIWLEPFAIIAVTVMVSETVAFLKKPVWRYIFYSVSGLVSAAAILISVQAPDKIPFDGPYDFGQQYQTDPAVDIALQAKAKTPNNALFIQPISFTELKYYGERSSYVDYKILVHRQDKMLEWHRRIERLYGIGINGKELGFAALPVAEHRFRNLREAELRNLKHATGITHLLTWKTHKLVMPVVAENEVYKIYRIE